MNVIWSKLGWKGDYSRARLLCFANQWIVQDIPSLSSFHVANVISIRRAKRLQVMIESCFAGALLLLL